LQAEEKEETTVMAVMTDASRQTMIKLFAYPRPATPSNACTPPIPTIFPFFYQDVYLSLMRDLFAPSEVPTGTATCDNAFSLRGDLHNPLNYKVDNPFLIQDSFAASSAT
jgi:hypothetical protein